MKTKHPNSYLENVMQYMYYLCCGVVQCSYHSYSGMKGVFSVKKMLCLTLYHFLN